MLSARRTSKQEVLHMWEQLCRLHSEAMKRFKFPDRAILALNEEPGCDPQGSKDVYTLASTVLLEYLIL